MTITKLIRLPAAAIAITLVTACSFFNATPSACIEAAQEAGLPKSVIDQLRNPHYLNPVQQAVLQQTLKRAGIDDLCNPSQSPHPESTPEAKAQNPTPPTNEPGPRISPSTEHRRICQFWALNNLQPVVYNEFTNLNPDSMDDLDRILWRSKLHTSDTLGYYQFQNDGSDYKPELMPRDPGIYCRDYWTEPLNRGNADLRNQRFEPECRFNLEKQAITQYSHLANSLNQDQEEQNLAYETPNQYIKILKWLDLSGEDLFNSAHPPYQVLAEQASRPYSYDSDLMTTMEQLTDYNTSTGHPIDLEWIGIIAAAGLTENGSSALRSCHYYYPQLFYGYWIPFHHGHMASKDGSKNLDLPRYDDATTPIYLPMSVTATKIPRGYPLGQTAGDYRLCRNGTDTEAAGYYYVAHPTGDYCEPK